MTLARFVRPYGVPAYRLAAVRRGWRHSVSPWVCSLSHGSSFAPSDRRRCRISRLALPAVRAARVPQVDCGPQDAPAPTLALHPHPCRRRPPLPPPPLQLPLRRSPQGMMPTCMCEVVRQPACLYQPPRRRLSRRRHSHWSRCLWMVKPSSHDWSGAHPALHQRTAATLQ